MIMPTLPALLFGLVTALLMGAFYHVVRGGNGWRLLQDFGLSMLGFALGQFADLVTGWILFDFGSLDLGSGLLGSLTLLILGEWLSTIKPKPKSRV